MPQLLFLVMRFKYFSNFLTYNTIYSLQLFLSKGMFELTRCLWLDSSVTSKPHMYIMLIDVM